MTSLDDSFKIDDAPVPSSKSGKGFEELYRLKGVVSHRIESSQCQCQCQCFEPPDARERTQFFKDSHSREQVGCFLLK